MCEYCDFIKNKTNKVFENENFFAFLAPEPSCPGHIIVVPKNHFPILEEMPDSLAGELFLVANDLSGVVFQAIGAHGTNVLLNNGITANQDVPHVSVHVLPRQENDNLNFEWEHKPASQEELSSNESLIKNSCSSLGIFDVKKSSEPKEVVIEKISDAPKPANNDDSEASSEKISEEKSDTKKEVEYPNVVEDNYLIRQLKRLP